MQIEDTPRAGSGTVDLLFSVDPGWRRNLKQEDNEASPDSKPGSSPQRKSS